MCRHIVMVLPYCASCDAMEELISSNKDKFKNLNEYEIVNISGLNSSKKYKNTNQVKTKINECESEDKKTITLTVNRMLTGSTVRQWDTMIYLKDTSSPQEYDQAIFRLQNQYVRTLKSGDEIIKQNLKPQTILVDFDPNRLFIMQEQKSLIYNANVDKTGNTKLKDRIEEEVRISPIITMNHNKIKKVTARNILEVISDYNNSRSVADEVLDMVVDLSILEDDEVKKVINMQGEFSSRQGLTIYPYEDEEDDLDLEDPSKDPSPSNDDSSLDKDDNKTDDEKVDEDGLENKIKTYYLRILFYTFLSNDKVVSLDDILQKMYKENNQRIAHNLSLDKTILEKISCLMNPHVRTSLDYSIQRISSLANDENLPPLERAMTSIKRFDRMSDSEVITPLKLCRDMVKRLPEESMESIVSNREKFLDLGCKSGEFAVSIYQRLTEELEFTHEKVRDLIYAIPTSPIAYEFTRKFYEILDLDVDNIASNFDAYDLLNVKDTYKNVDVERVKNILKQDNKFSEIDLDTQVKDGDSRVEFGAIIGNPPYQESNSSRNRNDSIYNYFYDISFELSDEVCLITPARFLFNIGSTPVKWNRKMLNDPHFKILNYSANSNDVFPNVDIKGGLVISYRNTENNYHPIKIFIPHENLKTISEKVKSISNIDEFKYIMYVQNKFNLDVLYSDYKNFKNILGSNGKERRLTSSIFKSLPTLFYDNKISNEYIGIIGRENNQRITKYIHKKYVDDNGNLNKYKVLVPAANGTGEFGEILSTPVIAEPNIGHTQTFISLGDFDTFFEAEALMKYIKTKFLRAMLGIKKVTQNNKTPETWSQIPLQNFTEDSDIDWTTTIDEIDRQLYNKYNLSDDEITFIETKVKKMD